MKNEKWEHVIILLIGIWLFSIPWTVGWGFGANDINVIMWNFVMIGVVISFTSVVSIRMNKIWAEWLSLIMGAWLIISPVLLFYYKNNFFLWNSIIFGVSIIGLSALSLPIEEKQKIYSILLRKNHRSQLKH